MSIHFFTIKKNFEINLLQIYHKCNYNDAIIYLILMSHRDIHSILHNERVRTEQPNQIRLRRGQGPA